MIKLCERHGYEKKKRGGKGSHVKLKKPGNPTIHLAGDRKDLSVGVTKNALKALGDFSLRELPQLLKSA